MTNNIHRNRYVVRIRKYGMPALCDATVAHHTALRAATKTLASIIRGKRREADICEAFIYDRKTRAVYSLNDARAHLANRPSPAF